MAETRSSVLARPAFGRAVARERGISMGALWTLVACAVPAIVMLIPALKVVDVAYGLRTGQIMLDTHALVRTDPFGLATAGLPWLNQQWGAQILMALVYRAGGWDAMVLARAVLSGLAFSLVYASCRERGADPRRAAVLTIAGFVLAVGHDMRAELFGLVLLATTIRLVTARRRHPGLIWPVPLVTVVWANVHGSFVLAPALIGLAYLEDRSERRPDSRRVLLAGLLTLGATAVTPWGPGVWPYALGLSTSKMITDTVREWGPTTLRTGTGVLFYVSAAAVVWILARRSEPVPRTSLLALGLFFAGGLWAIRGVAWWGVAAPVILTPLLPPADTTRERADRPSRVNTAIAAAVVLGGLLLLPWWRTLDRPPETLLAFAPSTLTDELRQVVGPQTRMFNPQIWGSWFELEIPGQPTFVDARIEVVPDAVWRDYDAISSARTGWEQIVDRWGFDVIVASRTQQAPLIDALKTAPGWRAAYSGVEGVVYVRSTLG